MFYWIYDMPTWSMVVTFSAVLIGFTWLGTVFLRPFARLFVRSQPGLNDVVGYLLGAHGVYFGILLGLLALSAYQNYTDADGYVTTESGRLAALYRDVSSYPEPARGELQGLLREYTRYVFQEAWTQYRRGIVPSGGTLRISRFQAKLLRFEPATTGQGILHTETLRQFNSFVEARQVRVSAVTAGIPSILWYVVFIGVAINILLVWLLDMRLVAHLFLGGVAAFFLATLISLIAAMDNPFRGEVSITPDAFQLVYDQLMTDGMAPTRSSSP